MFYRNVNRRLSTSLLPVKKDEELTFVAIGNRSQAKEEKGEKIHSVHLRKERRGEGGGGQQGGVRKEKGGTCINN